MKELELARSVRVGERRGYLRGVTILRFEPGCIGNEAETDAS